MLPGENLPADHGCGFAGSGGCFVLDFWIANLFRFSRLGFQIF